MNNTARPDIYDRMARIISLLFHPLFMPVYGLVFLLNAPTFLRYLPVEAKKIIQEQIGKFKEAKLQLTMQLEGNADEFREMLTHVEKLKQ